MNDSQTKKLSNVVKITKDFCKGCKLCIVYCPRGMLKVDGHLNKLGFQAVVFVEKASNGCTGCRFCVLMCPEGCIEVIKDEPKK